MHTHPTLVKGSLPVSPLLWPPITVAVDISTAVWQDQEMPCCTFPHPPTPGHTLHVSPSQHRRHIVTPAGLCIKTRVRLTPSLLTSSPACHPEFTALTHSLCLSTLSSSHNNRHSRVQGRPGQPSTQASSLWPLASPYLSLSLPFGWNKLPSF